MSLDQSERDLADSRPVVAVTMGDGAGVGPEVVVGALVHDLDRAVRPIVIGDAARLRAAAAVLGVEVDIVPVKSAGEAVYRPGRINVVDLGLLPADLPWGQLSAVAGDAAYHYVRVACAMAMRGEVQAIGTAPLNKEALHAAGHIYPGHTELLAHLTGTPEVSMMLSTPKVKVIHVTTHIGLLDAVELIEPGLVERTIRRGWDALRRAGVERPVIGVCGINPHAGENRIFGDQDADILEPAVARARERGINAHGPIPADALIPAAVRGKWNIVIACYHDQGHAPFKAVYGDDGVNITIGLPVVRVSVDHGTAFDIAGKGIAREASLVLSCQRAAELAPGWDSVWQAAQHSESITA
jgi:4-hydroxythreonine-4-phosphate dehydrogenase